MKTSNKLLIAFAAALFVIPLLGMIYVSRVNFKVGNYTDIAERKTEDFTATVKDMESIPLSAFRSVNFVDAKRYSLIIKFVKDDKFGIRFPANFRDLIHATVDENGQLQISLKDSDMERTHQTIYVFAPTLAEVNVNNAEGAYVVATVDSLLFNAKNTGSASTATGAHIKSLTINTTNVGEVNFREDDVKSLTLNLNNTRFRSESNSYEHLAISTTGTCDIDIRGTYDSDNKYSINNLTLNTGGKTAVNLENIKVLNCAGSFSDETTVNMPAVNINQMYKR